MSRRSAVGPDLQPTLDELSVAGRSSFKVPHAPAGALDGVPAEHLRVRPAALPEVDEPTVVYHFVRLSHLNYSVDSGFYPLGSCTMKYNPKVNEWALACRAWRAPSVGPGWPAQGTLELMWRLQRQLGEIGGFPAVALQPAAGAHGELTGILVIRAWHTSRGDAARDEVIVPDSSHGTNPATASMAGYRTVTVASRPDGSVDLEALRSRPARTAAVMLTNPSTLGLFEDGRGAAGCRPCRRRARLHGWRQHERHAGPLPTRRAGFDVMHFNLHKTFSTPHGGGGPGAGPIAVAEHLAPFLPGPLVVAEPDGTYRLERPAERPASIGRVRGYHGSTGVLVRAYAYIRAHGGPGLRQVSDDAVLAANYLRQRVGQAYGAALRGPLQARVRGHRAARSGETGVRTLDIAKRLIDYGFHPPTIYFPLIVEECMLIEPTETGIDRDPGRLR